MESFWALVIGIVSSLLATVLFVSAVELVKRVILPWYADYIYRGVRIDGSWLAGPYSTDDPSEIRSMALELNQKGDHISGLYSHTVAVGEDKATVTYHLKGTLRDAYLAATLHPVARDFLDAGTILARVYYLDGALRLKGAIACVAQASGSVHAYLDKEFHKTGSAAIPPAKV